MFYELIQQSTYKQEFRAPINKSLEFQWSHKGGFQWDEMREVKSFPNFFKASMNIQLNIIFKDKGNNGNLENKGLDSGVWLPVKTTFQC